MKGKDITVGLDVAFHPTSNASSKYNKPFRGEVVKVIAKGEKYMTKHRRYGGKIVDVENIADQAYYEVKVTEEGNGDWGQHKAGSIVRVKSANIWRPWGEQATKQERAAAAAAREEQRRLSTWAAYDAMIADINADLALIHVTLPENVLQRVEWNRTYRDAPKSLDLPLDFIALLAGAIG